MPAVLQLVLRAAHIPFWHRWLQQFELERQDWPSETHWVPHLPAMQDVLQQSVGDTQDAPSGVHLLMVDAHVLVAESQSAEQQSRLEMHV